MDAANTIWYGCNEEMQLRNDNNNSTNEQTNNDNNNNSSHTNSNSTKHTNPTESAYSSVSAPQQVTFNHSKASELRQKRLQRQHEQQHSTQAQVVASSPIVFTRPNQTLATATAAAVAEPVAPVSKVFEKSHCYPSIVPTHRLTRRRRLQRQKPTELDDVDFAYAADLEEEDEDEEAEMLKPQQQQPGNVLRNAVSHHVSATHDMAEKRLQHFPHQSTAFDGQPSSLPNCFTTTAAITTFQHQQHHHQFHHHQQRERRLKHEESFDSSTTTTTNTTDTATSPASPPLRRHHFAMLKRDNSTHSESSSRYSSVDSLLEARKPDPEAILINLGFGPVGSEDILSRIPKRFLKPSQVRGIDTEAFVRRLQLASNLADHSVLGYRGLTGNPDIQPSRIVAKIMQRFEVNERKKSMGSIEQTI